MTKFADTKSQNLPLKGVTVLVTRAVHQANNQIDSLRERGATVVHLPCLDIKPLPQATPSPSGQADTIIFTSVNAVNCWAQIDQHKKSSNLTDIGKRLNVFAIGSSTAKRLNTLGINVAAAPLSPFNSESLLKMLSQQVSLGLELGNVCVIKGQGGRNFLNLELPKLAKKVEFIDVYIRTLPDVRQEQVDAVFLKSAPDIVTITSNETLQNLVKLAGGRHAERLMQLPLVVNSDRGAQLANVLGFKSHVLIAQQPGDQGQLNAISNWNRSYRFKL